MEFNPPLAILGAGNIGTAIARGLVGSGALGERDIHLTRRNAHLLEPFEDEGYNVGSDNADAVRRSNGIIVAVEPQQLDALLADIGGVLDPERHTLISVVTSVKLAELASRLPGGIAVARAMPNTAVTIGESMTCLAGAEGSPALAMAESVFGRVGQTLVIDEEQMIAATALGACGVAFFLRAIRAASQGGIEVGFHSAEALAIAAQTARGAASLLLRMERHPEHEVDRVTTPRGCTIAGLNQMEHEGFSSAMIKGIVTSATKAEKLY